MRVLLIFISLLPFYSFGQRDTVCVYQRAPFVSLTLFSDNSFCFQRPKNCGVNRIEWGVYSIKSDSLIELLVDSTSISGKIANDVLALDQDKWFLQKSFYAKNRKHIVVEFENKWNTEQPSFKRIEYYENGAKKSEGNFKLARKHGKWRYFSADGKSVEKEKWDLGKKVG